MNKRLIFQYLGKILFVLTAALLPSLIISLVYNDGDAMAFVYTILIVLCVALPLYFFSKPSVLSLRPREGFLAVALTWLALSFFGALPYVFSNLIPNFVDALFESIGGFTTTGSTVINDYDNLHKGLFFWRSFTNWIGGTGILVLTLALTPSKASATYLMQAELPGPVSSKLVPKLSKTAKILYGIYAGFTILLIIIFLFSGMTFYDALVHGVSTAGTGGLSNHATNAGHYNSPVIDGITTVFMLLFSINFGLFYHMITVSPKAILKSSETKLFLGIYLGGVILMTLNLLPHYGNLLTAFRYASFQGASVISTSGFTTADYGLWPQLSQAVLFLFMFLGGCGGSTSGGLKIVRLGILLKATKRYVRQVFSPRKVEAIHWEGKATDTTLVTQIALFFFLYISIIIVGTLLISIDSPFDFGTNFSAALTSMSNVGSGFGNLSPSGSFAPFSPFSKIVLAFIMLAGRLEIFPMLILFSPSVWKKG